MATLAELLNAMTLHRGVDNGIESSHLARQLGINGRALRHLISEARDEGIALCGHPARGYYMAITAEELKLCEDFLERRAIHTLRQLARMRQVSLPDLVGQLRLNQ